MLPDLRLSIHGLGEGFVAIVREGLSGKSMPSFRAWMSDDEIREIAAYLRQRAGS